MATAGSPMLHLLLRPGFNMKRRRRQAVLTSSLVAARESEMRHHYLKLPATSKSGVAERCRCGCGQRRGGSPTPLLDRVLALAFPAFFHLCKLCPLCVPLTRPFDRFRTPLPPQQMTSAVQVGRSVCAAARSAGTVIGLSPRLWVAHATRGNEVVADQILTRARQGQEPIIVLIPDTLQRFNVAAFSRRTLVGGAAQRRAKVECAPLFSCILRAVDRLAPLLRQRVRVMSWTDLEEGDLLLSAHVDLVRGVAQADPVFGGAVDTVALAHLAVRQKHGPSHGAAAASSSSKLPLLREYIFHELPVLLCGIDLNDGTMYRLRCPKIQPLRSANVIEFATCVVSFEPLQPCYVPLG